MHNRKIQAQKMASCNNFLLSRSSFKPFLHKDLLGRESHRPRRERPQVITRIFVALRVRAKNAHRPACRRSNQAAADVPRQRKTMTDKKNSAPEDDLDPHRLAR